MVTMGRVSLTKPRNRVYYNNNKFTYGKSCLLSKLTRLFFSVVDWANGQPDDYGNGIQKCTMFYARDGYRWVDIECEGSREARTLCERD